MKEDSVLLGEWRRWWPHRCPTMWSAEEAHAKSWWWVLAYCSSMSFFCLHVRGDERDPFALDAGKGNCFKQVWSMSYTLTSWRFDYYVAWALDLGWANSSLSLLLFLCSTHMAGDDKLLYLVGSLTTACGICRYIGTTYDNYTYIYLYPYQQNSANSTKIIMCSNFHANIPLQGHKIKPSIYHLWERSHAHTHNYPCHEPLWLCVFSMANN